MNAPTKPSKPLRIDWKKLVVIGAIVAVGGYQWYTGSTPGNDPIVATSPGDRPTKRESDQRENTGPAENSSRTTRLETRATPRDGTYLKPTGGKNLKSPSGLIYTGGRSEHRTDHVLRHAHDIPNRDGPHGVFEADGDDVFRLIDEVYELIKNRSRQVQTTPEGDGKVEYVVDMKRKIGYLGGQTGGRKNNPPLYKVKLILGDNRVITAFPF